MRDALVESVDGRSKPRWNGREVRWRPSAMVRGDLRRIVAETRMDIDEIFERMWAFAAERGFLDELGYEGPTSVIGEVVRKERNKMGWTAQVLASALGVTPYIVEQIELGAKLAPLVISGLSAWLQLPYSAVRAALSQPWRGGRPLPADLFGDLTPLPRERTTLSFCHIGSSYGKLMQQGGPFVVVCMGEERYAFDTAEEAQAKMESLLRPSALFVRRWTIETERDFGKLKLSKSSAVMPRAAAATVKGVAAVTVEEEDEGAWVPQGPEEEPPVPSDAYLRGWYDDDEETPDVPEVAHRARAPSPPLLLPSDDDILPSIEDLASGKPLVPPPNLTAYAAQFWKPLSEKEKEEAKRWRDSLP